MTQTRINVITYKIEWSRPEKTCLGWRTPAAQSLGVEAFKSTRSIFLVLWQPLAFRGVGGFVGCFLVWLHLESGASGLVFAVV